MVRTGQAPKSVANAVEWRRVLSLARSRIEDDVYRQRVTQPKHLNTHRYVLFTLITAKKRAIYTALGRGKVKENAYASLIPEGSKLV